MKLASGAFSMIEYARMVDNLSFSGINVENITRYDGGVLRYKITRRPTPGNHFNNPSPNP